MAYAGSNTCTLLTTGKRKRQASLVLHLSGSSSCESDHGAVSEISSSDSPVASSSKTQLSIAPIIINGKLVADGVKRYHCTFEGCAKAYKKPARLEEHERTHTGERPFVCSTCQKTYFRDTHLHAHMRSHQPDSSRPFACSHDGCEKKFWTAQHLFRHQELHSGEKLYKCVEPECNLSFSKHNQLRSHISSAHCPPGTKNFRCEHDGCTKSFSTSQKLKAHGKSHEDRRYTCSHSACLQKDKQKFFPNWTALQAHTRIAHPPGCPYASCKGKVFTQQKGLRAHLKLHEQREIEDALALAGDADDESDERPIKRRRGGEVGRDWECTEDDCGKDFKSKSALETHIKVAHLRRRDFICAVEGCGVSFGYKHLLQRHTVRTHTVHDPGEELESVNPDAPLTASKTTGENKQNTIDILTGKAYEDRGRKRLETQNALVCPHPDMSCLLAINAASRMSNQQNSPACTFVFSRAYDFRRHLSSAHGLAVDRKEALALMGALRCEKTSCGML